MTTTACARCIVAGAVKNHQGRCFPQMHTPGGGDGKGPFRSGKTYRDKNVTHAYGRNVLNRAADPLRRVQGNRSQKKKA